MIKLGKVSAKTRGPVIIGFGEDVTCLVPGAMYPCPHCSL